MPDLFQYFGQDLVASGGDLALADENTETLQFVARRLLTAPAAASDVLPADYLWQTEYGGGLRRMIGQTSTPSRIEGRIRGQLFFESGVAQSPAPLITVKPTPGGEFFVNIAYNDANSGAPMLLNLPVSATP